MPKITGFFRDWANVHKILSAVFCLLPVDKRSQDRHSLADT